MKIWPILKSLISFQPPEEILGPIIEKENRNHEPEENPTSSLRNLSRVEKEHFIEKLWVDHTFRIWISFLSFFICFAMFLTGSISSFFPVLFLFSFYIGIEIAVTGLLLYYQARRAIDFMLCFMDIVAISIAIHYTGGSASPLFFLYFIPIIIQAFHRDWPLILFYGFGGGIGYSISMFFSLNTLGSHHVLHLIERIFCMFLAVGASTLGVRLLLKKEKKEEARLSRLRLLTQVSQSCNTITSIREVPFLLKELIRLLNEDVAKQLKSWSRAFLVDETGISLNAVVDDDHEKPDLKQELSCPSCPSVRNNKVFLVNDCDKELSCPTESFSFASIMCVPISGTDNEVYGTIFTGSRRSHAFQKEEEEFFQFIGRELGLTIQRLHRVQELSLSFEMDSCAMAAFLASTKSIGQTSQVILDGILNILKSDQASLFLWNPHTSTLQVQDVIGPYAHQEKDLVFHMGEGIPGCVLETATPIWTSDSQNDPHLKNISFDFKTLVSLPLHNIKGEPIGVVNAWYLKEEKMVSNFEIDIASTFVTRATLALENALMHQKKKDIIDRTAADKAA